MSYFTQMACIKLEGGIHSGQHFEYMHQSSPKLNFILKIWVGVGLFGTDRTDK